MSMLRTASRVIAGPSRYGTAHVTPVVAARRIATLPLLRQIDRVPPGRVRPRRIVPQSPQSPHAQSQSQPHAQHEPVYIHEPADPFGGPTFANVDSRPVVVPADPSGVLSESHAARELLANHTLVIVRQLEMLNVFMGYEQANRYAIHTPTGELVGYMAEEEVGILSVLSRQTLRTHRPFKATIMDRTGQPILWIRRPFQFINSRIFVHAGQGGKLVGETQQEWHPWRRRYNVFQSKDEESFRQFARVDSGFLAWDFWLKDKDDRLVASINRNFRGIGRELFTDTGQYVIRFDSAGTELDIPPGSDVSVQGQTLVVPGDSQGLTLDQRAMTLATAVSIDFDYFSRHSGSGGMGLPFFMWGTGDGSSDVNAGRGDGAAGAGAAGVGAAGAMGGQRGMSEDEQIYGRQPASGDAPARESSDEWYNTGMDGHREESWEDEQMMDDPWSDTGGEGGGGWSDFFPDQ